MAGCKYVVLFEPRDRNEPLAENEKKIEKSIAVLLPLGTKTDKQALRTFQKMRRGGLNKRSKKIALCKIIRQYVEISEVYQGIERRIEEGEG